MAANRQKMAIIKLEWKCSIGAPLITVPYSTDLSSFNRCTEQIKSDSKSQAAYASRIFHTLLLIRTSQVDRHGFSHLQRSRLMLPLDWDIVTALSEYFQIKFAVFCASPIVWAKVSCFSFALLHKFADWNSEFFRFDPICERNVKSKQNRIKQVARWWKKEWQTVNHLLSFGFFFSK